MMTKSKRKLAAIVFADIAGYTAIMQQDEDKARTLVQKFRVSSTDVVNQFGGTIINFYGDGCVSMFDSSVNALRCARTLQQHFLEEPTIPVRIGVHSGDIYLEEDNIYGDSVNVASRIQSIGIPGSVLFSQRILKDIRNQEGLISSPVGEFYFKNVDEKMEIYALHGSGLAVPTRGEVEKEKLEERKPSRSLSQKRLITLGVILSLAILSYTGYQYFFPTMSNAVVFTERKPSIAVLPFTDLSVNRDQGVFSEGIADEILSYLINIRSFKVIARSSSFALKDAPVRTIRDSLNVDFVLEGSLKKDGENAVINVRLIDTRDESSIWAERFVKAGAGIIEVQRDIARSIAARLDPGIPEFEINKKIKVSTKNLEAFEKYLRAKELSVNATDRTVLFQLLYDAISHDSEFAEAYALLAWNLTMSATEWNGLPVDTAYQEAISAIDKALSINSENSEFYIILGAIRLYFEWDFADAERQFEKAIGVGGWPEAPTSFCFCSFIHLFYATKRFEKAAQLLQRVIEIDPAYHRRKADLGLTNFYQGKWDEAELYWKSCLKENGDIPSQLGILYILQGRYQEAINVLDTALVDFGRDPRTLAVLAVAYHRSDSLDAFSLIVEELNTRQQRREKLMEDGLALLYAGIGQNKEAIDWLERAFVARSTSLTELQVEPFFKRLHDEPRFQALLRVVGFN